MTYLAAIFGRVYANGVQIPLQGGLNYLPPFVITRDDEAGILNVALSAGALEAPKVRCVAATPIAANTRSGNVITITANGAFAAVDGVTLALNDRILLAAEAAGANNGIWYLSRQGGASTQAQLTRAIDADESAKVATAMVVRVQEGTSFAGSAWQLATTGAITLNTTALDFRLLEILPRVARFSSTNSSSTAATVTALNYTIPEGYLVKVVFEAVGMQGAEVGIYGKVATYYRRTGQNAADGWKTTIGKTPDSGTAPFESDAAWDADIVRSTNDLAFQVKQNGENPGAKWDCRVSIVAIPLPT